MDELSLYILDIAVNSVRAGATEIIITITETDEKFCFCIDDNGCGMTEEQTEAAFSPFFTTRTNRKIGLGLPLLKMLAEMTGGRAELKSSAGEQNGFHGTTVKAEFCKNCLDSLPPGDITATVITLIQGSPNMDFVFIHKTPHGDIRLFTKEIKEMLGGISLSEPTVLGWIEEYLRGQYNAAY